MIKNEAKPSFRESQSLQQQKRMLRQRNLLLVNEVLNLNKIITANNSALNEIRKSVSCKIGKSAKVVHSFSIVDRNLEDSNSGGVLGLRRSLSYQISSHIFQSIVQSLKQVQQEIDRIFDKHTAQIRSLLEGSQYQLVELHHAKDITAAPSLVPVVMQITYEVPVELIMETNNIQEFPWLVQQQKNQIINSAEIKEKGANQTSAQNKDQIEIQSIKKVLECVSVQNMKLKKWIKQCLTNSCEFQILIDHLESNDNQINADTPLQIIVENEADELFQVTLQEQNIEATNTIKEKEVGQMMPTSKTIGQIPTRPEINISPSRSQIAQSKNDQNESVISIDMQDEERAEVLNQLETNQAKPKDQIYIQDHSVPLPTIPYNKPMKAPVSVIMEKIRYIEVPIIKEKIVQRRIEVVKIVQIAVEMQHQGERQRIREIPVQLYIDRLVEMPVEMIFQVQKIVVVVVPKIFEIPVEVALVETCLYADIKASSAEEEKNTQIIQVTSEVEAPFNIQVQKLKSECIDKEIATQKIGAKNTSRKMQIIQIPVELQIDNSEQRKELKMKYRQKITALNERYCAQMKQLHTQLENLQKIILQSNQLKQEMVFQLQSKALNQEFLRKKILDKDAMILKKQQEIQNVIKNHQQNMKMFESYKEQYSHFIHNVSSIQNNANKNKIDDNKTDFEQVINKGLCSQCSSKFLEKANTDDQNLQKTELLMQVPMEGSSLIYDVRNNDKDYESSPKEKTAKKAIIEVPIEVYTQREVFTQAIAIQTDFAKTSQKQAKPDAMRSQKSRSLEEDMTNYKNEGQIEEFKGKQKKCELDDIQMNEERLCLKDSVQNEQQLYDNALNELEKYRQLYHEMDHQSLLLKCEIDKLITNHQQQIRKNEDFVCVQAGEINQKDREIEEQQKYVAEWQAKYVKQEEKMDKLEQLYDKLKMESAELEQSLSREVDRLKDIISDQIYAINEYKQEYNQSQGLFQAQIQRIREELTTKQEQIQHLQSQNNKKANKIEQLIDQSEEMRKIIAFLKQNSQSMNAIYERQFQKVKRHFEDKNTQTAQKLQSAMNKVEILEAQLETEVRSKEKALQQGNALANQLSRIRISYANLCQQKQRSNESYKQHSRDMTKKLQQLQRQLKVKGQAIRQFDQSHNQIDANLNREDDFESIQSIHLRVRMEYLSRVKEQEGSQFNEVYIKNLEALLLKYEGITKKDHNMIEQLQQRLCQYLRYVLIKEHQLESLQSKYVNKQNTANNILVEKITLQMQNKRLLKMTDLYKRKANMLGKQLIETSARLHQQTDDYNYCNL